MKKLIIAVAAVIMTTFAQAAAVTWNSGTIASDGSGAAITSAGKITAYLWTINAEDYANYVAMDAATLSQTVGQAYVAGELGTAEKSASNTYSSRGGAAINNFTGTTQYNAGDTAYGLILYVDDANEMYMANVASKTFASAQGQTVGELALKLGGTNDNRGATAWAAAVPEPTSGLLMLLGMAGLALRRRRA